MDVALPYSADRRYLTGVDWVIGTLDSMTRATTGAGNSSQVILELEGCIDGAVLSDALSQLALDIPALFGYPSRDWLNLAPFWHIPRDSDGKKIPLLVHTLAGDTGSRDVLDILVRAANSPFQSSRDHVAFELVHCGDQRSWLGMRFDHWLFDARGGELLLQQLNASAAENPHPVPYEVTHPSRQPHLSQWAQKFRAGKNVNRAIRNLPAKDAAQLSLPSDGGTGNYQFHFAHLDESTTKRFCDEAYATGGFLMKLPYALALAVEGVDLVLRQRGANPEHYIIPVSIDRRSGRADNQALLFNHLSFVHFHITREHLSSRSVLVAAIAEQMYEQTKSRLPEDFEEAMFPMRIAPVGLLSRFARMLFAGNFGSFAFSFVRSGGYPESHFMGHRVLNLLHTPRVSAPPGFGIFANEFGGKMNVTVAHLDGMLSPAEASIIAEQFTTTRP